MSTAHPLDEAVGVPRLFSVLGGAVTRASLLQVQQDVDAIAEVSCATSSVRSSSAAPTNTPPSNANTLSLRRMLDALRAARANAAVEATADVSKAHGVALSSVSASAVASDAEVRDTLIRALGVPTGSALFRTCVTAPRHRIQRVVEQLCVAVRTRYLPLLQHHRGDLLPPGEPLDMHVQLYPSSTDTSISAVPPALSEHRGFCAAITVRRLAALEAEAEAEQRLTQRYMNVAAAGQTLTSSLAFWSDVSYGDTPPAALVGYPPLGFQRGDSVGTTGPPAHVNNTGVETQRWLGRKTLRSTGLDAAAAEGTMGGPSLLLGLPERPQQLSSDLSRRPTLVQPELLVSHDMAAQGAGEPSKGSGGGGGRRAPLPHVTYSLAGVVAVLYVHCSGVAYVGGPPLLSPASVPQLGDATSVGEAEVCATTPVQVANVLAAPSDERGGEGAQRLAAARRLCPLPMLSSTGFTRSLLGLS